MILEHRIQTMFASLLVLAAMGCVTSEPKPAQESKFYKSVAVRRCLQFEKETKVNEAQACWADLLRRLEDSPNFRTKAELSDSDVAKIRQKAGQSQQKAHKMNRELQACFNLPSRPRQQRIDCFEKYLAAHKDELKQSERYEIKNAIASTRDAEKKASGSIEATMEHAGKLLGADLHTEDGGLRVDAVHGGPMAQAQCPAQGMIVLIDDLLVTEMDAAEIISRLEACQEKPVTLTVRHGGLKEVSFHRITCSCGKQASGKREWRILMPAEACSEKDSPELTYGIEWCYEAAAGLLHVESVCAGSPAAEAGVRPDHEYTHLGDHLVLGKSLHQIRALLEQTPIQFVEKGGSLRSPQPLDGKRMDKAAKSKCWQAIQELDKGTNKTPL